MIHQIYKILRDIGFSFKDQDLWKQQKTRNKKVL